MSSRHHADQRRLPPRTSAQPRAQRAQPKLPVAEIVPDDIPVVQAVEVITPAGPPAPAAPPAWASVELAPSLPMRTWTSTEIWHPERIGALAIYCSDGRWGDAFDEFCHRSLHLPRYDRFALPGGPAWLTEQHGRLSTPGFAMKEQLDFLVRVHELERIVLITHFGCAFYQELLKQDAQAALPRQFDDVRAAAGQLRRWFPSIEVDAYLAMREESRLSFHTIELS